MAAEFNTPNILASEANLVIHSKIQIDCPASIVFRSLRNTETWRDWNRFVPRVNITYQPPEDDHVTAKEIQELVRNTSIAGSFYSDLTDGGVGVRPRSPDEQPPPRYRLPSVSSQMSGISQPRASQSLDVARNDSLQPRASVSSNTSSVKSGAQKYQEALDSRRSSIANGEEPAPIQNQVQNTQSHRASVVSPLSPATGKGKKQKYTQVVTPGPAMAKAQQALLSVYGEPSVRLQMKTKLTFYMRMKPMSPSDLTEMNIVVIEIARPDDPITEAGTTALTRSKTHTLDRAGIYRVTWSNDSEGSSIFNVTNLFGGNKMPKSLLQLERVHQIEPTGDETCVYKTWELQKGYSAKSNKKKHGDYLQKMSDVWCSNLKDFCEGLHAPKIDRRDFSITAEDVPVVIQTVT